MTLHNNSLANLKRGKRFGHGQPTSLGGAPKGKRLTTWLRELGEQEIEYIDVDGLSRHMPAKRAIAVALLAKALGGDVPAIKLVGSFYLSNDEAEPLRYEVDDTMIKMLAEMGLNVDAITQREDVVMIEGTNHETKKQYF